MHPTSLPSDYGIGSLGAEAFNFIDFLEKAKQTYWQVLPLGPTGFGDSPYQSFSAFAGNTNLISPELLVEDALLTFDEINEKPDFPNGRVDFGLLYDWKNSLLAKAYERFRISASDDLRGKFETFSQDMAFWLDDYALYRAIKFSQSQKPWYQWEDSLKLRDENALAEARENLREAIREQKFYQFLFFTQWFAVKKYANEKGVKIVGDVPIFVALDSADVWCNPQEFKLNSDGSPKFVAGVPPDYFSADGQLWGNPIYNWDAMREKNFDWWVSRVKFTLQIVDIVRVDHFRGFAASWEVPGGDKTAAGGQWVNVPGKELFETLKKEIGDLPFWAEDLGVITLDVRELRDDFSFPGMRILQYAFGGDANNHDLPHNYINNCVAYTGTHDNDTTVGWFSSQSGAGSTRAEVEISREREFCLKYLNSDGAEIHWDFIRAIWSSVANTTIAPMQDLLGLGNEARMNLPASESGNWFWQCKSEEFSEEVAERLRNLTGVYGR